MIGTITEQRDVISPQNYDRVKALEAENEQLKLKIRQWASPKGVHRSCNCHWCEELEKEVKQ